MDDWVYLIVFFPDYRRAACFNRGYHYLGEAKELWQHLKMGDVVQSSKNYLPTHAPEWAERLRKQGDSCVALWFNEPERPDDRAELPHGCPHCEHLAFCVCDDR